MRNNSEFILYRAWAEFRSEASRAYLGFAWWFLEPLIYVGAFYFVFAVGIRGRGPEFAPFLLCALVGWKWFSSSVLRAGRWAQVNSGILQEVYVPKWLFVCVSLANNFMKFVIVFVMMIAFLLLSGVEPTMYWGYSSIVLFVEGVFIFGSAMLVAAVVPFVPDTRILLDNMMLMLFFLSGIFFDVNEMSPFAQSLLQWNPLIHVFDAYRATFLRASPPDMIPLSLVGLCGMVLGAVGLFLLHRYDRRYPRMAL